MIDKPLLPTYNLPVHLNNLRVLNDYIKSRYTTFEIFMDAIDNGLVPHLKNEFGTSKIPIDRNGNPERESILEEPSDEILQHLKQITPIDNTEQYFNRIEYEIDRILNLIPNYPEHFGLEEIKHIVLNKFKLINSFISAEQDVIDTYINIMSHYPPEKFFEAVSEYDSKSRLKQEFQNRNNVITTCETWYPNIFTSSEAYSFFDFLITNRAKEKQLAEISFYYRKFKYHHFIHAEIREIDCIRWLSETYHIELTKIKTQPNCYTENREKYFNLLKDQYMK
ncbi:hypothetical protein ACNI3T_05380 [Christiangramia sp. ASW11-125]|uniref:hypothetical protein n=1 Tax=Christiangramia sp. ASW11-125 TaxID=3400701 RepID=UPI003AADF51E